MTQLNVQSWTNSLFVPRIDFSITKMQVKQYFEETYPIGTVSRVDFVSFNNDKGVGRRAFIHFSKFTDELLKETLLNEGKYDVCLDGHNIRLVVNEKPVPETKLNLNQVAHNTEFIGDEVKNQQKKIDELENKVETLENELANLRDIVLKFQSYPMPMPQTMPQMMPQMMPSVQMQPGNPFMQMYLPRPVDMYHMQQQWTQPEAASGISENNIYPESLV